MEESTMRASAGLTVGLAATAALCCTFALLAGSGLSATADRAEAAASGNTLAQVPSHAAPAHRVAVRNVTVRGQYPVAAELSDEISLDTADEELATADFAPRPAARAAAAPVAGAQQQGGGVAGGACPGEGSCFEPHGGLGCDLEECCDAVCFFVPDCCTFGWDSTCVAIAESLEACEVLPDCTKFAHPDAIYSNWHPDCWHFGYVPPPPLEPGPTSVIADDLWWGENGGVVEEITFAVYNGTANVSNLNTVTLEVLLSTTTPGNLNGELDLSSVFASFEVELTDLDLEPGSAVIVTIEPEGTITLPTWGIYAGQRYLSATFADEFSSMESLGYVRPWPVAVGGSNRGFFRQYAGQSQTFSTGPGNFIWEIVVDSDPGPTQILFDNAPQHLVISGTTGNPTNGGFSSGVSGTTGNMLWVTMPFELGPVPDGGDAWRVTHFMPHGFLPGDTQPNIETLGWAVWHRTGNEAPGDMIAEGSIPYPWLHQSHPLNNRPAAMHIIPVDLVLEPGEYFLTVYGDGPSGQTTFAWFANAQNGINMVGPNGPFYWRASNFPGPWSQVQTSFSPHPDQPDPDTLTASMFVVLGEVADATPTPCPGDLTGSGSVGVGDLLALLGCWGPVAPSCENADLSDSGSVGVADLLILLGNWGPCP